MKKLRSFKIKSIPATNTKPRRIQITDQHNWKYIFISANNDDRDIDDTARKYLESIGIPIVAITGSNHTNGLGYNLLLTESYDTMLYKRKDA